GRAPRSFVGRAAVAAALVHGALVARATHLTPLGVGGAVLEIAVAGLFVDLRDADLAATADEKDLRLFAAHQWPIDRVDDAIVQQRREAYGNLHATLTDIARRLAARDHLALFLSRT